MRRGILGGTFDPPHIAHLFAAEAAYTELGLDVVTFLPAGAPWQKAGRRVSAAPHRRSMTELAVRDIDYFASDGREIDREGPTYTVDTLREFEDDRLFLILGSDAAAGLPTWHRPDEVLARAEVVVAPRPGGPRAEVDAVLVGGCHWLDVPELDISGTMLRARVARGASVRFLVPDPVAAYITAHGLYRSDPEAVSPAAPPASMIPPSDEQQGDAGTSPPTETP